MSEPKKEYWWVSVAGATCEPAVVVCGEIIYTFGCPDPLDLSVVTLVEQMLRIPLTPKEQEKQEREWARARTRDHRYRAGATMSEPKRYAVKLTPLGSKIIESLSGQYVMWPDYAALRSELERLRGFEPCARIVRRDGIGAVHCNVLRMWHESAKAKNYATHEFIGGAFDAALVAETEEVAK